MKLKKIENKILIIQQNNRGIAKANWIKSYAKNLLKVQVASISSNLPLIIDDTSEYLPNLDKIDLVLDYLEHPDLSNDIVKFCTDRSIPIISSGKKCSFSKQHFVPIVCCAFKNINSIITDLYPKYFGKPKLMVIIKKNKIVKINVKKGAPCGSTWKAAEKMNGVHICNAAKKFGLNIQYFCKASASHWDPIINKNPIHVAADIHKNEMDRILYKYLN